MSAPGAKRAYPLQFLTACALALAVFAPGAQAFTPLRVVIDPGHGGADEGTVAFHASRFGVLRVSEKDLTLTIALRLAQALRNAGVKVVLTRERDQEIPLAARTQTANRKKADLFISLHMNAAQPDRAQVAEGVETYILNSGSDATSKRLARMETAVFSEYDTGGRSDVAVILKDLRLNSNLSQSKHLACLVQKHLVEASRGSQRPQNGSKIQVRSKSSASDRGVKQALFHVLLGADMPSILVELGFLSSQKDRTRLLSDLGQRSAVSALTQSILEFGRLRHTSLASKLTAECQVHGQ